MRSIRERRSDEMRALPARFLWHHASIRSDGATAMNKIVRNHIRSRTCSPTCASTGGQDDRARCRCIEVENERHARSAGAKKAGRGAQEAADP